MIKTDFARLVVVYVGKGKFARFSWQLKFCWARCALSVRPLLALGEVGLPEEGTRFVCTFCWWLWWWRRRRRGRCLCVVAMRRRRRFLAFIVVDVVVVVPTETEAQSEWNLVHKIGPSSAFVGQRALRRRAIPMALSGRLQCSAVHCSAGDGEAPRTLASQDARSSCAPPWPAQNNRHAFILLSASCRNSCRTRNDHLGQREILVLCRRRRAP